ncbi:DUF6283 family protein [Amycolatopsis sp. CA-230715]|uniref:DUF6283 family protein n=1 Tax=Amycolatopsis sp. CA-230715 TaxID=2745196 RepID=UPI001C323160|nr:DUF6283 family protein [Amycolatopsis sp. CA-230715]QWF81109.1 hypothetical protein HUW46_04535 [Amycolatopsis sp. CA-230715]
MDDQQIEPPAPRPCASCPYRRDVPSGVWDVTEYAKLPLYDAETGLQPGGLFQCHQNDGEHTHRRICAGWAGCHDGDELLALRLAVRSGRIIPETAQATVNYQSPIPLFDSGADAAIHGVRDIETPDSEALRAIEKIRRVRSDLIETEPS